MERNEVKDILEDLAEPNNQEESIINIAGNVHIGNNFTNNNQVPPTQNLAFIDENLKSNLRKLIDDVYKIRLRNGQKEQDRKWIWWRLNTYMDVSNYGQIKQINYLEAEKFLTDWIKCWKNPSQEAKNLWKEMHKLKDINKNRYFAFLKSEYSSQSMKDLTGKELKYTMEKMTNQSTSADFEE
ncbi:hypothetical protein [Candidatus Thioglobus sp.]|uniref:hypothetical protein n=1 Tax=Candidatus Thioglobus sp. TaxID=2026721 RepID=UPI003D0D04C3